MAAAGVTLLWRASQASLDDVCKNPDAVLVVALQWGSVTLLLLAMLAAYLLARGLNLKARLQSRWEDGVRWSVWGVIRAQHQVHVGASGRTPLWHLACVGRV